MLFNSIEFLLFLPIVFLLYWFVFNKKLTWQNGLVLVASYIFYGWWSWKFLALLIFSTLLDYLYGFGVASTNRKKARFFLWLSILNNLGILAVFKYYNFFIAQIQTLLEHSNIHYSPIFLNIAIPVGISFYTFHGMSYVFDISRGQQKPVKNFIDYAVFVSFFPLLVAGPIERANHLLPQVQRSRYFNYLQAVEGCRLILWGLFKKIVIADSLSIIVENIFHNYQNQNSITLITGAFAFSFQIYGDFSGYSDIALGVAKLFGFELLSNFKFPYFSRDLAEFWRRWHISLSSWFRDYLYIPLGGSRNGKLFAIRNTFIIFLVSGFWHGASWNYIVWGGIHACGFLPLLITNRNRKNIDEVVAANSMFPNLVEIIQIVATFLFVSFAWIFFRSENLNDAYGFISRLISEVVNNPKQLLSLPEGKSAVFYIIPLLIGDWYFRRDERHLKLTNWIFYVILSLLVIEYLFVEFNQVQNFIYFQF